MEEGGGRIRFESMLVVEQIGFRGGLFPQGTPFLSMFHSNKNVVTFYSLVKWHTDVGKMQMWKRALEKHSI